MRIIALTLLLTLAACTVQETTGTNLTTFDPVWDCHVEAEFDSGGDNVLFTASDVCGENRIIPFTIQNDGNVVYDGGVYAHNTTSWPTPVQPGLYEVVHGQHGGLIATVVVE